VGWIGLIVVLRFLGVEDDAESHGVGLIDDGPFATGHLAHVKMEDSRLEIKVLLGTGYQGIGGFGLGRIRPEDDHV
jgi:hypothetical protein